VIVSASGADVVEPIAHWLGADHWVASDLEIVDGRYTGNITFYAHGANKAAAMRELAVAHGWDLSSSYAYSDSSTDIPMLEAVGFPHAVNPDSELRAMALERGWPVLRWQRSVSLRERLPKIDKATGTRLAIGAVLLALLWRWSRSRSKRAAGDS
jgi:phosphoserine phosphatase